MAKSPTLQQKLDKLFVEDVCVSEFESLLQNTISPARFDTQEELQHHLAEGALLNIGVIGSKALSIPCGEYMVWATDAGHTMLVPVESKKPEKEVFEAAHENYEVLTPELLNHWNKVERVLAEEDMGEGGGESGGESETEGTPADPGPGAPEFKSRVNPADIDRSPMLRAMEQQGHTVTSLSAAVGVDPPAISRLLRTPKDRQGDPGGRNPSIGLASRIANELRMDVEALFPDIFGVPKQDLGARETPANRGSGMTGAAHGSVRKGRATEKWTRGNTSESRTRRTNTINEAGPEGGRHPGRMNEPGFEKNQIGPFALMKITRPSAGSKRILRAFGMDPRFFEMYAPVYVILKDGAPYAAGSHHNGNTWYNTQDYPLRNASPGLIRVMQDLGVPPELIPSGSEQIGEARRRDDE